MANETEIQKNAPKKKPNKILKIIGRIVLVIFICFILLVVAIRTPWAQNFIIGKVVSFVSGKTHTKIAIKKLFITFDGDVQLDGLYLEDTKGDTLIYSKSMEANVPLWAMVRSKGMGVDALNWEGVRANIIRNDSVSGYNFQFLLDAFASKDSATVKTDTTAAPVNIVLGRLLFKDFDIVFNDAVAGINSRFKIGTLKARMKKTDLEQMVFEASNLELAQSDIKFIEKSVPKTPQEKPSQLPSFVVKKLRLDHVIAYYKSDETTMEASVGINALYAEIPNINLTSKTFELDDFRLKNSAITLHTQTEKNAPTQQAEKDPAPFEWPAIRFAIGSLDFENNKFSYFVNKTKAKSGYLNPNALELTNFDLLANSIQLKDKTANLHIENAQFKERSGFNLKALKLNFNATDTALTLSNLKASLNNTFMEGDLQMNYQALAKLLETPEKSKVALNIPTYKVALQDLFIFQPELKKNEILNTLSKKIISGTAKADGYLSAINLTSLQANWGNSTNISANGTLQNITNPEKIQFNIPRFSASTTRSDVGEFVSEKALGVQLPKNIHLSGYLKGSPNDLISKAKLTTSQGTAILDGRYKNKEAVAFNVTLSIEDYQLNELLQNPKLGKLNGVIKTQGKGKNINTLDASMVATVSSFKYNTYQIKDLTWKGDVKNGKGTVVSNYKDYNLDLALKANVVLDSVAPEAQVVLNLNGADLQALGLMERPVRTGMNMYVDYKGNSTNYDVTARIDDGVVVYNNKTYLMGDLNVAAHVRKDTTSFRIKNKLLDAELHSNTDPKSFSAALQHHVRSYFYSTKQPLDSLPHPVNLKLRAHISQAPILNDVFLVNMKQLDTVNIAVDFNQRAKVLKANITAPHIHYSGYELDSLDFAMNTNKETFNFNLGFNTLKAGPIHIQKTVFKGNQANNKMALEFVAFHNEEKLIAIASDITGTDKQLRFHVVPENLIVNKQAWNIPNTNEILITKNKLAFNDFKFSKNNQSIEITDKSASSSKDNIAIYFKDFKLSDFLSYLNPDKKLATGNLNGRFVVEEPFTNTGLVANLDISQLSLLNTHLGTLSMDAKSLGGNNYNFKAAMKGGDVDLDLTGDYVANKTGANLDLTLDINTFKMKALTGFSQGEITDAKGSFSGNFKLNGTTTQPKYEGSITFKNADFKVAVLNAGFGLKNETIKITNEKLAMTNFIVRDENQNTFAVSGNIGTESFINPTFNLQIKADNFQFLNATKEDNDFLYGKASFNADATITGDLQIPKINASLTVGSNTNVTYVVPSSSVNIEERDGTVIFVNRKNSDAILTRTKEKTATITGFDMAVKLKVLKDAAVTIVIDKETGDNFKVSGKGDFDLAMNPNGNITLAGIYEVDSGHYEMNLYNLVNRKFNLNPGSQVTWSGDPLDAKLDVSATYQVKTSASSLMAPVFSNDDPSVKGKFRQVLPFYVYLNIDGQLMQPKIAFNLDMPEDEKGAIGGQVYGRVQQLNQQEDELNRQVFSLLVLNRFYPDPGSDGSSGGVVSMARDNLNDAVSDQLNTFSDKLFNKSGFELNFGLDSYTDYQGNAPQDRTQLDIAAQKKLFNDRLIVSVGSEVAIEGSSDNEEETPLIGNVSIEYLLTENGHYRLKGFRRNEFENVIDGQTIVSGIAVIFTQEFNKFHELWEALLKGQTEAEKQAEKERKAAKKTQKRKEETTQESMEKKKN